jgi:hypothetical protein
MFTTYNQFIDNKSKLIRERNSEYMVRFGSGMVLGIGIGLGLRSRSGLAVRAVMGLATGAIVGAVVVSSAFDTDTSSGVILYDNATIYKVATEKQWIYF